MDGQCLCYGGGGGGGDVVGMWWGCGEDRQALPTKTDTEQKTPRTDWGNRTNIGDTCGGDYR